MKPPVIALGPVNPLVLVAVVGGLFVAWKSYQGAKTLVTETINPVSQKNIVNQGFESLTGALIPESSGQPFGAWLYDVINGEPEPFISGPVVLPVSGSAADPIPYY